MSSVGEHWKRVWPYLALLGISLSFWSCVKVLGYSVTTGSDNLAQVLPGLTLVENRIIELDWGFWDWSYGLGGDVFSEMSYYFTTSPFFYFDLVIKLAAGLAGGDLAQQIDANCLIATIHQIMIMWAMCFLLRSEKLQNPLAVIGSIVYGMSVWVAQMSVSFSFMVVAAFWLPVLVWAFRRYQTTGKWVGFSVSIGLCVANSFYFGFQTCLFLVTLFLVFSYSQRIGLREYFGRLLKLAGVTLVGLALSSVSLFVAVGTLLEADRSPVPIIVSLLPSIETILQLPLYFFMGDLSFALLGIPSLCIMFVPLLLSRGENELDSKRSFLALLWVVLFLIPFTGNLMNGMSASLVRWHFILLFVLAWNIPHWLNRYASKTPSATFLVAAIIVTGLAVYQGMCEPTRVRSLTALAGIFMMATCVATYALARVKSSKGYGKIQKKQRFAKVATVSIVFCVCLSAFAVSFDCCVRLAMPYDAETTSRALFKNDSMMNDWDTQGNEFSTMRRVDNAALAQTTGRSDNWSWLSGYHSTALYNSMVNGDLHRWFKRLYDIPGFAVTPSFYRGFNNRYFLETAWAVKYKVGIDYVDSASADVAMKPYGRFVEKETDDGRLYYENEIETGLGLWYTTVISYDLFEKMDYAERDAALLQAVVVPDGIASNYPSAVLDDVTEIQRFDWAGASYEKCGFEDGMLVAKEGAVIRFPLKAKGSTRDGEWLFSCDIINIEDERFTITVNGFSQLKMPSTYAWAYPLTEYSFALPGDAAELKVELTPGVYQISNPRIAYNSYDYVDEWVEDRNSLNLATVEVSGDQIEGTVVCSEDGILVLSVPYSKGWNCWVDGIPVEPFEANKAFLGIELGTGNHSLKFAYFPRFLIPGTATTGVTILALCIYTAVRFVRRRGADS